VRCINLGWATPNEQSLNPEQLTEDWIDMAQVFVSYSHKDYDFVERIAKDLKAEGLDVWYDSSRLNGGQKWTQEIERAIRQSQYFIVVLSPDSIISPWVEKEYLFAEELTKKHKLTIIPLLLQKCKLPIWCLDRQYIDVQGKKYKLNFENLRKALQIEQSDKIDCVILCGGYSQRLWPLTDEISKVLLPVAGKPSIEYVIDFVQEVSIINKIILSVNKKFASQIENYVARYKLQGTSNHPIEIIVEPSTQEKEKLGPVGALQFITQQSSARDLLVLGGDNIYGFRLEDFMDYIYKTGRAWSCNAMIDDRMHNYVEGGKVKLDNEGKFVRQVLENPQKPLNKTTYYLTSLA
jgi:choline kinase